MNQRFIWDEQTITTPFIPVHLNTEVIKDIKTSEVVVKRVTVWTGYAGGKEYFRFWTNMEPYIPEIAQFSKLRRAYQHLGREEI